jgi:hypothetical protein
VGGDQARHISPNWRFVGEIEDRVLVPTEYSPRFA